MKIAIEEYIRADGSSPYQAWFSSLDIHAAAKVTIAKARMELGNTSSIKWFRGIGEHVIDWGPGYRIYLLREGEKLIVLLGGSNKRDQQKAIEQAIALHEEYKTRKKDLAAGKKGKQP